MAMKSSSKLYMEDIFITGILRDKCNIELKFVLQILNDECISLPKKIFYNLFESAKIAHFLEKHVSLSFIAFVICNILSYQMPYLVVTFGLRR